MEGMGGQLASIEMRQIGAIPLAIPIVWFDILKYRILNYNTRVEILLCHLVRTAGFCYVINLDYLLELLHLHSGHS